MGLGQSRCPSKRKRGLGLAAKWGHVSVLQELRPNWGLGESGCPSKRKQALHLAVKWRHVRVAGTQGEFWF